MGRYEKLLLKILRGTSDVNIGFDELHQLLLLFGCQRGPSHLSQSGVEERINLQQDGSKANGTIPNLCLSAFFPLALGLSVLFL